MPETSERQVTIAGNRFRLRRGQVERRMRGVPADPIAEHFVVVNGRRYPPKQVIREITGLDRADFTSHQARRILMRLGFSTGRREKESPGRSTDASHAASALADALSDLAGQWVAVRGDEVLVSASSPQVVVSWLARHDERADSMFRVPEDETAAVGIAPL